MNQISSTRIVVTGLWIALAAWLGTASSGVYARTCEVATPECQDVAALLANREGFGRLAKGGLGGPIVTVTSTEDSGPGSLRDILKSAKGPVWITFAQDLAITLKSQLQVPSNVTIDGRGRRVTLLTYGITIQHDNHDIILTHFAVDGQFKAESQAVDISGGAHDVWLNHLTLSRTNDRLVNVKRGATDVTISWVRFENHNKVMLLNNLISDNLFSEYERDRNVRVTVSHSYFHNTIQRNPRVQIGYIHFYNNLLEDWDFYGMSFSLEARAIVEGNMFSNRKARPCVEPEAFKTVEKIDSNYCRLIPTAPLRSALGNGEADKAAYEATKEKYGYKHDYRAFLIVRDNYLEGDAALGLTSFQPERVESLSYCYKYEKPDAELASRIRRQAGALGTTTLKQPQTICPTKDSRAIENVR
jgi:pectate lyase